MRTLLTPEELLDRLHEIEQAANRTREIHWGPRTLDMDIIFYDDEIISIKDELRNPLPILKCIEMLKKGNVLPLDTILKTWHSVEAPAPFEKISIDEIIAKIACG